MSGGKVVTTIKIRWNYVRGLNFALVLSVVFILVLSMQARSYADAGTWLDGDFPTLSVDHTSTTFMQGRKTCVLTSFFYFSYGTDPKSEGKIQSAGGCDESNALGDFYNSNNDETADNFDFIEPTTSIAFRVLSPDGHLAGVTPIPVQAGFFWKEGSTRWGNPVAPHFYTDFGTAGSFGKYSYGAYPHNTRELAYELNTVGSTLSDSVGNKLYMHSYAFSGNGAWMVAEIDGLGLVRIDTKSLDMQLFDQIKLAYNLGFSPQMKLAISNDGKLVVKSGQNVGNTTVYDLSGCQHSPFKVGVDNSSAILGCQHRDLEQSLRAQLSNYQYLYSMHFDNSGKSISAVAVSTGLNGIALYNDVQYSVAGYSPAHVGYIALGDSFSSGEGAYDYVLGTNSSDNSCHLSYRSYPYLAASVLDINDFHSVACSGAVSDNYFSPQEAQNPNEINPLGSWEPGIKAQQTYLYRADNTSVVTISMIGNDIGFSAKLKRCLLVADSCFHYKEDRESIADEIYGKFHTLVSLYRQIKEDSGDPDHVKVYVLGYPQIVGNGSCGANVWFDPEERQMAQGMIAYLDAVIKAATVNAGVQYIDVEHAFDGHRLCENAPFAVNGLSVDRSAIHGPSGIVDVANSSFHPDPLGHELMSQSLLLQSDNFTKPMPDQSLVHVPYVDSPEYDAFVNNAPTGGTVTRLVYVGGSETWAVVRRAELPFVINLGITAANQAYQVWFNSSPTYAGTLMSDKDGNIVGNVPVPGDLDPGYHMVHIYGKDIAGQDIDMYETVYVAASADDYNGDGIPNDQDPCVIVPASGVDQDRDGIDDACDGDVEPAPADTTPPEITGVPDREPDHDGWYDHDVAIHWTSSDPGPSSGDPTQPEDTIANIEGDHTYTSGQSCDPVGNCANGSLDVKLDKTSPSISFTTDPVPNTSGWNSTATTVTFLCADGVNGVASCTDPITVSGDGVHILTGTATDNAGNTTTTSATINIDKTAPSVDGFEWLGNPRATGGTAILTVHASDNLSGVSRAEYFVGDSDPGAGHATAMPASSTGFASAFGEDMPVGVYKVNMRTEDAAGNWSAVASDYLVIYNPFSTSMIGHRFATPSLENGDNLPWLDSAPQDSAKFAFSVGYDMKGNQLPNNALQFMYNTGSQCNNPGKAHSCHSFALDATSVGWFTVQGAGNSIGICQGNARLVIDGEAQSVLFMLAGVDSERLGPTVQDHLRLQIFKEGDNPSSAQPIYRIDDDVARGNINVRS